MPNPFPDAAPAGPGRDSLGRRGRLGPYETAYEVRRGYERSGEAPEPAPAAFPEPVWIGRRRER